MATDRVPAPRASTVKDFYSVRVKGGVRELVYGTFRPATRYYICMDPASELGPAGETRLEQEVRATTPAPPTVTWEPISVKLGVKDV